MSDDKKLAERLARADAGEDHWRRASKLSRKYRAEHWRDRIETIRRAGLELVEREDGR